MSNHFENTAISIYQNNLIYFEKFQNNIFSKLASFESAIENGHHQKKYDLILQDTYFDVLELSSNNYLYAQNSDDYAKLVSKSVNYDKSSNVYETFRKINLKNKNLKKYEQVDIKENNLSGIVSILDYIDKNKINDNQLDSIDKFIFFGVGLGQHIIEIDKKINANMYFIIEDDLELFKLSLFTTPYYELALKSKLLFSVFDDNTEFSHLAKIFLEERFYNNHYIKYFQMLNHSDDKLEEFHIKIASQSHNLFFYDAILQQYLRPLNYLNKKYKFLNILHSYASTFLGDKPILYIAAGPSLQNNLKWVQINQDKFVIVALSATLSILEEHNITPNIITHLDGFDDSIPHFEKINSIDFFHNTIFLLSARTPQAILDYINKDNIFLFENGTSYKKNLGNLSAPCIGSTTYLLLLAFGVKNLYLLGLDLALDNITGSTHADGHYQSKILDTNKSHPDTITFKNHLIEVAGNLRKHVMTLPDWKSSIESIHSSSIGFKKENQTVYNLSDGAKFSNTLSVDIDTLSIDVFESINKYDAYQNILKNFTKYSSNTLTKSESLLLKQRLLYAQNLKVKIQIQKKEIFTSYKSFKDSMIEIIRLCTTDTSSVAYDLSLVYQEYIKLIYTFIFDFFNSSSLKNKVEHSNNINKLLCTQLLRIVDAYTDGLLFIK